MKREQRLLQKGLNISLTTENCSVVCCWFFLKKKKKSSPSSTKPKRTDPYSAEQLSFYPQHKLWDEFHRQTDISIRDRLML